MATNTKAKLNDKAITQLTTELQQLKDSADSWYKNEYKSSNDKLYGMFTSLYALYEKYIGNDDKVQTDIHTFLMNACTEKKVTFKLKKPTIQALLVKFMFDDGITSDCKRINSYVRVFTLATTLPNVTSKSMAKWIVESGGIENVRQQQTTKGVDKETRIAEGLKLLKSTKEVSSFKNEKTKENASSNKGEAVLLVGIQKADGSVSIRHTIYAEEKGSTTKGKTVINTALANVYSTNMKLKEKEKPTKEAEVKEKNKRVTTDEMIANEKKKAKDTSATTTELAA